MNAWPLRLLGPPHRSRAAALAMLLLAATMLAQLPGVWSVAEYLGILDLALVIAGLVAAVWLWFSDAVEPRLVALLIALLAITGHVLAKTLGLPGASSVNGAPGRWELVIMAGQLAAIVEISMELASLRRP